MEEVVERFGEGGEAEVEACLAELCGEDALSAGEDIGDLSEGDAQGELGDGEPTGAPEGSCECASEVAIGDGIGGGGVEGTLEGGVVEGEEDDVDEVVEVDPGDPLAAAADGATDVEAEGEEHLLERASVGGEDDAGAEEDGADADVGGFSGLGLPLDGELGEEVGARGCVFGEGFVVAGAIVSDGGCIDEASGRGVGSTDGFDDVVRCTDAGGSDLFFLRLGPAVCEDGLAGEVHDGIMVRQVLPPRARGGGIALEQGDGIGEEGARGVSAAGQDSDGVATPDEVGSEVATDQAGAAGDEDPHSPPSFLSGEKTARISIRWSPAGRAAYISVALY